MAPDTDPFSALPDAIAGRIRRYVPACLDDASWARIADQARDLVARSAPTTPKMAQDRLSTLCGLAASAPEDERHDFDVLFSPPVMACYEATCGVTVRSLKQYRGRLQLLADIHHDAYRSRRKTTTSLEPGPDVDEALVDLLEDPCVPEPVVRFVVAGLGAGREDVEASRCRLQHNETGPVVVRPTGRTRPVTGPLRRHAEAIAEGVLVCGEDRRAALDWLADHGHAAPAPRAMSATWLCRVIAETAPATVTIARHALSRSELDRATKLVAHATGAPSDRTLLRGATGSENSRASVGKSLAAR